MIGKLLLTLLALLGGYAVVRARVRERRVALGLESPRPPLVPMRALRLAASLLLALMAVGSSLYLLQSWLERQEVVRVQVINANTGQVTHYESRRGSIEGRRFATLDGREIRLADVERLIVLPAESGDDR